MKKFTITIGDKEFLIKLSFRSLITYEELSGKMYNDIKSLKDILTYMYSCIISSNDICLEFDEFMVMVEQYPDTVEEFINQISSKDSSDEKKQ